MPLAPDFARESGLTPRSFLFYCLIALILAAAVWARFQGLAWHFTHNDDIGVAKTILDRKLSTGNAWAAVPEIWTYAPFQFLLTNLLLSNQDTYRGLLYWGRVPSAIAGIAGVVLSFRFYRRFEGKQSWTALSAAALIACSWENIIHAKQMHNYALGVPAAFGVLLLLLAGFKVTQRGIFRSALIGAALAALVSMHYEILFFVPAFFLTLFLHGIVERRGSIAFQLGRVAAGAGAFLLCLYPLWLFFISTHLDKRKDGWSWGPAQEFVLRFNEDAGLGEKIFGTFTFYLRNFFGVLQANLAFVPDGHFLYLPAVYYALSIFFVLGIISFMDTASREKRILGWFFALTIATWFVLVAFEKLALAPTRHNLILLPLMAIITAEGAGYFFVRLFAKAGAARAVHGTFAAFALTSFILTYPQFLAERRDPFEEELIMQKIREYEVDAVIPPAAVQHITAMKSVREHFGYYMPGLMESEIIAADNPPYKTIAWISHRLKLTPDNFEIIRRGVNDYLQNRNFFQTRMGKKPVPFLDYRFADFEIIYSEEKDSSVEIDFSNRTRNGTNSYYFYILKRKGA